MSENILPRRLPNNLETLLRIGCAACFIGHGAFGLIGKEGWLPYFAVFGIPTDLAWKIMPLVGFIDVLAGLSVLLSPRRGVLLYMAFWGLFTAMLRPLAGESGWEAVERAGNYGVPLALLMLLGAPRNWRDLFTSAGGTHLRSVDTVLRASTVLLLIGHGGLALGGKPMLQAHLALLGLPPSSMLVLGAFEIAMAAVIAFRRSPALLLFACLWKVGSESLFLLAGAPVWEFIERGGSYVAPLALALLSSAKVAGPSAFAHNTNIGTRS